uniref:Nanos-type domain-containing protein n=1 Tax=Callorhinchus milii TaxID=7868 RepID=A0A4W3IAL1_CALMI
KLLPPLQDSSLNQILILTVGQSTLMEIQPELTSKPSNRVLKNICAFCKQNRESEHIYNSHALKDNEGKIICPVLRRYTCPLCNASGDRAHTKRFCHLLVTLFTSGGRPKALHRTQCKVN